MRTVIGAVLVALFSQVIVAQSKAPVSERERATRIKAAEAILDGPKKSDEDEVRDRALDDLSSLRAWESSEVLARSAAVESRSYRVDPRINPRLRNRPTFQMEYPANAVLSGLGASSLPGIVDVAAGAQTDSKLAENLRMTVGYIVNNRVLARDLVLALRPPTMKPEEEKALREFVSYPDYAADIARQKPIAEHFRKELGHSDPKRVVKAIEDIARDRVWGVTPELVERLDLARPGERSADFEEEFPAVSAVIGIGPGALPAIVESLSRKDRSAEFRRHAAYCIARIVKLQNGQAACRTLLERLAAHYPKERAARVMAVESEIPELDEE